MNINETKEILQKLCSGDKIAIDLLYNSYSNKLYNFAFSYLKTEDDALDVVQNVFVSLWEKRDQLKRDSNLEAFLFTVTKNAVVSLFRKKVQEKKYLEHLRHTVVIEKNITEEEYNYQVLSDKISTLIEQLPEQRKRVLKLDKEEGLSNKQIAEKLNISVKTVEDHKTKAKRFIKEKLAQSGFVALLFVELFL